MISQPQRAAAAHGVVRSSANKAAAAPANERPTCLAASRSKSTRARPVRAANPTSGHADFTRARSASRAASGAAHPRLQLRVLAQNRRAPANRSPAEVAFIGSSVQCCAYAASSSGGRSWGRVACGKRGHEVLTFRAAAYSVARV